MRFNLKFGSCRKFYSIRATVLQEDEEKVSVEESFQPKSFPEDDAKSSGGAPPDSSSSSVLDGWIIKFEQSFNIFLTVMILFFFISHFIRHDRLSLSR